MLTLALSYNNNFLFPLNLSLVNLNINLDVFCVSVFRANDGCLYVFDLGENKRTLKVSTTLCCFSFSCSGVSYLFHLLFLSRPRQIDAHEDDVNAVAFADSSSQLLYSGSDDAVCKVWDRRTLREDRPRPVGQLAGHRDGITFIHSKVAQRPGGRSLKRCCCFISLSVGGLDDV